ncbi:MAG: hypothetical protein IPN76_33395 [Saprospiraceae bacterium]|nr:hypothetical protein [Saprospiraceae bacterium]
METITNEPILFDLNTDIATGFTWGRHLVEYGGQSSYANRPILQVGRYEGGFPFELEFNALTPSGWHTETRLIPESDILSSDSLARESWVGLQLDDMVGNNLGDAEIQAMIELSIQERVLCDFTAFIALEPSQGGVPCTNSGVN